MLTLVAVASLVSIPLLAFSSLRWWSCGSLTLEGLWRPPSPQAAPEPDRDGDQ